MTENHPIQNEKFSSLDSKITLRAYEVYCHVFGEQIAMVSGGCRGGFGTGELLAFLYARSFPKEEWRDRVLEAFGGMKK